MSRRLVRRRAASVGKKTLSLKGTAKSTSRRPKSGASKPTNWKVFVYLAGDNNLSDEMIWSLLGMQTAVEDRRFRQRVELTAVYDPSGRAPLVYEFPARNGHDPASVGLRAFGGGRSPLAGLNRLSTFDQLRHFVDQQLDDPKRYPPGVAVPTMIVLSGHGNGVDGMLAEERRDGPLLVPQLGKLLEHATAKRRSAGSPGKVKILGLEACAMGIIELCYEVRHSVEVVLGTESFVENNGWPYERILKPLSDATLRKATPAAVAVAMARIYSQYYREYDIGGVSTDISVVKLENIEGELAGPIRELGALLTRTLRLGENEPAMSSAEAHKAAGGHKGKAEALLDALIVAHWNAQTYSMDGYVDLDDWLVRLQRALRGVEGLAEVVKRAESVRKGLETVVEASFYQGPAFQHSNGLSIYLPGSLSRYNAGYEDLAFDRDTRWSDFVKLYLQRSQRGVRRERAGGTLYTYEAKSAPVGATQVPGSVRNPPNGSKRQNPPNGSRMDRPDGFFKNGPHDWYRDPRDGSKSPAIKGHEESAEADAAVS